MSETSVLDVTADSRFDAISLYSVHETKRCGAIPMEGHRDARRAVMILNDTKHEVSFTLKAGDGVRSALGDWHIRIPAESIALASLWDSARFKSFRGDRVYYEVTWGDATEIDDAWLDLITLIAVNL